MAGGGTKSAGRVSPLRSLYFDEECNAQHDDLLPLLLLWPLAGAWMSESK